jgi:putative flippase GtrA
LISQVFSFIISFFVGFLFQKHITFQKKWGAIKKQWLRFFLFQVIGIALNMLIMRWLVEYFHLHYLIASVIAKIFVFARNFAMNYKYNFKE